MRLGFCLLVTVAACCSPEKEDYTKDKPVEAPVPSSSSSLVAVKKAHTPEELGTCHMNATGAVTAELTSQGGKNATNVSYWYTADEQKLMAGVDGFVIDCKGADFEFKVVPGGGKKDGMPFKQKKYDFAAGKGDGVLMIMFGKKPLDKPTGSIDVTAFDSHHIAGTVDLSGTLNGAAEKITGNFDLICPDLSGCDK